MLEKDIEKILTTEIKKLGGRAYKFISPGNSGVPDRIVVLPGGKMMFVELKAKTGSLSVLQSVQVKRLIELGQKVYVVYGLKGLKDFFNEIGAHEAAAKMQKKLEGGKQ
ncbi:MAG: VRR-NUC domain-containing protein [Clostridiales bacterium]|nr:VRR-NUC domain-containing protein [Clostridiales bacterium]